MMTEIYVHEVVGVPGSDVGHLPYWGRGPWTICNGPAIEAAIENLRERNHALHREGRHDEVVSWWVDASTRRPCKRCVREADREHQTRLDQIRAMGGRP